MRPMSCPTTRTFEYPSERTAAWTRSAEVFISMPVFGIDESPMPGRSGAMTVNRGASTFASGFHIRDVSAYPWISTAGGPLPPTVTLIVPPSTATDCVLNPGPKSAAYRGAAPTIKARLQSANMDKARRQRKMRYMTDSSGLADRSVVNRLSSPEYLKKISPESTAPREPLVRGQRDWSWRARSTSCLEWSRREDVQGSRAS